MSDRRGYDERDIYSGNRLLREFVGAVENRSTVHAGQQVFWGGRLTGCTPEERRRLQELPQTPLRLYHWLCLDWGAGDGQTLVDALASTDRLGAGTGAYLQVMSESHLRLYRVAASTRRTMMLRDAWGGPTLRQVRHGNWRLPLGELIVARRIRRPDGSFGLLDDCYTFPQRLEPTLLDILRCYDEAIRAERPDRAESLLFKEMGTVFHHFWLDSVALPCMHAIAA